MNARQIFQQMLAAASIGAVVLLTPASAFALPLDPGGLIPSGGGAPSNVSNLLPAGADPSSLVPAGVDPSSLIPAGVDPSSLIPAGGLPSDGLGVGVPGGPSASLGASPEGASIGASAVPGGPSAGIGADATTGNVGADASAIPGVTDASIGANAFDQSAGANASAIPGVDAGLGASAQQAQASEGAEAP
jgi:hypothetical protein